MSALTLDLPHPIPPTPAGLFIGGRWTVGSGPPIGVEDPSTGEIFAEVANATVADAEEAIDAAADAQDEWAAVPARERGEILRAAFKEITREREGFAALIGLEMGKPRTDALAEVAYGAEFLRWFAEEAVRIEGSFAAAPEGGPRILTMKRPVGPALLITPWNFPLAMATRKVGPALAAGCTAILKPAAQTPLTALLFAATLERAGLPSGVLNVLVTSESAKISRALLADQRLRKVSFTGSTPVGRRLTAQAAPNLQRVSMELGGNGAFVVLEDADLDRAVAGAMVAKLRNGGQSCTAANRFLVHEKLAGEFSRRLASAMDGIKIGPAADSTAEVGPLVDAPQRERVLRLVRDAIEAGAEQLSAPRRLPERGHFVAPTVLSGVPADAPILAEEIFGPVAPVVEFGDDAEALALANDTEHGLVGFVFGSDFDRCLSFAEELRTGMVGINRGVVSNAAAPFGGIKQSGLGREGGRVGIEEYLDLKYVAA
ncbi:MAG TPA: NAD-dependent succinate-semialdehyde dehydrogenase [Solirubrobacterales bacterium]|jgi:succinate-semialdehyde dehydrogenase/glutarate-semialdehyde dehydrogenase|nr:NAD-dependent succinate-semialdehyde dehydrogenase [Solirubrobacterales bacterium]